MMQEERDKLYYVYSEPVLVMAEDKPDAVRRVREMMVNGFQPEFSLDYVEEVTLLKPKEVKKFC